MSKILHRWFIQIFPHLQMWLWVVQTNSFGNVLTLEDNIHWKILKGKKKSISIAVDENMSLLSSKDKLIILYISIIQGLGFNSLKHLELQTVAVNLRDGSHPRQTQWPCLCIKVSICRYVCGNLWEDSGIKPWVHLPEHGLLPFSF